MTSNTAAPANAACRAGADGVVDIAVASCISSQLQSRKPDEHQHHRDDPEANDDLIFFPALEFVVVMQRRHSEYPLAGQLERRHLQNYR